MKKIILIAFSFLLLCAATEKLNLVELLNKGILEEGEMIFWNEDPLNYATVERFENEDGSEEFKLMSEGKYYTISELAAIFAVEKEIENPYKLFKKENGKTLDDLIVEQDKQIDEVEPTPVEEETPPTQ
jgi:hypothetical protein